VKTVSNPGLPYTDFIDTEIRDTTYWLLQVRQENFF